MAKATVDGWLETGQKFADLWNQFTMSPQEKAQYDILLAQQRTEQLRLMSGSSGIGGIPWPWIIGGVAVVGVGYYVIKGL